MNHNRPLKPILLVVAFFAFGGYALVFSSLFRPGVASAQVSYDWKYIAGNAGIVHNCSFSPQFQVGGLSWGNELIFDWNGHTSADHCHVGWHLTRDHADHSPTIYVDVIQSGVTSPHGSISCNAAIMCVSATKWVDVVGTSTTISYAAANQGKPQRMNIITPTVVPTNCPGGFLQNGPLTVSCDVGNDFVVESVEWGEQGTD